MKLDVIRHCFAVASEPQSKLPDLTCHCLNAAGGVSGAGVSGTGSRRGAAGQYRRGGAVGRCAWLPSFRLRPKLLVELSAERLVGGRQPPLRLDLLSSAVVGGSEAAGGSAAGAAGTA